MIIIYTERQTQSEQYKQKPNWENADHVFLCRRAKEGTRIVFEVLKSRWLPKGEVLNSMLFIRILYYDVTRKLPDDDGTCV